MLSTFLSAEYMYLLVATASERTVSSQPLDEASNEAVHVRPAKQLVRRVTVPYYEKLAVNPPSEASNGVDSGDVGHPDGIVTKVEPEQEMEEGWSQTGVEESQSRKVSFAVLHVCFSNDFSRRIH